VNSEEIIAIIPKRKGVSPQRAVWAAFLSIVVPGLGQLLLGRRRSGWTFLALFTAWGWLFLSPFRLPRFYWAAVFLLIAGLALIVGSSWGALSSAATQGRRGLLALLIVLVPIGCYLTLFYCGLMFRAGGFNGFRDPSTAMEPTLMAGDALFVDMRYFNDHRPQHRDVVVLPSHQMRGAIIVKRIVAMGGDTIQGVDGKIYLSGKVVNEPYVKHIGHAPDWLMNFGPIRIPAHKLFVMGDNRDASLDSRAASFGLVDDNTLLGKALYITKPLRDRKTIH